MIKAVVKEYDVEKDRWRTIGIRKVYAITDSKIKIKMKWWKNPEWFNRFGYRLRFDIYDKSSRGYR